MTATLSPYINSVRVGSDVRSEAFSEAAVTKDQAALAGPGAASFGRDSLYAEFAPLVRRLVRQYGQNADMREDLAGEIYCRFCALLEAFDPERGVPLRPYLIRQLTMATYTYARQQWRIQKREATWESDETQAEQKTAIDPTPDWLAGLVKDQASALLPAAMAKLPARQRSIVIWRYYEERSFEEIAEILGILPSSARSLLRHGLNSLRKAIGSADCF